ncbi:MAG: FliM/FliN family flagellar motor C-terminal domain-containing protein, partial [Pseudomonadota bacterium]
EAPDFELYRLNADLGPGKRTGLMDIYLPHRPQLPEGGAHGGLDALARKLEKAAMNAPVTLDAALARLRRPLNEVLTWAPGTTLVVDPGMLSDGILLGAGDHEVARFKLGQFEGFRAVQLISDAALEDEPDSEAETAQPAESEGSPAQIAPPTDGEAAALDPTGENALAEIGLDISEPDAEGAAPAGKDDWPALGGLDDVAGDLDDLLQDIPESDLPDELPPDDAADDGDFAPLPMMVADIDLDE